MQSIYLENSEIFKYLPIVPGNYMYIAYFCIVFFQFNDIFFKKQFRLFRSSQCALIQALNFLNFANGTSDCAICPICFGRKQAEPKLIFEKDERNLHKDERHVYHR